MIIVDDVSTDATADLVQDYVTQYPEHIRFYHRPKNS